MLLAIPMSGVRWMAESSRDGWPCSLPDARDTRRSALNFDIVVGGHSNNLRAGIHFHELAGFRAILIYVVQHNTGKTPHYVDELKLEVWVCFESAPEVRAYCFSAFQGPGWIVQNPSRDRRHQDHIGRV